MSTESAMLSKPLILCHHLLFLPSIFTSIRVFSNDLALPIRWPKYWNFNFNISSSNEYSGLIYLRIDWFDLLAVQGTLKSLFQHHVWKHQFFGVQHSLWFISVHTHLYITTRKKHSFDYMDLGLQSDVSVFWNIIWVCHGLPWWLRQQRMWTQCRRPGFNPSVGKISWRTW